MGSRRFQARYKLPSKTKGAGEIVAIVDAYDNPNVSSDLAEYRSEFRLGSANLKKYNQKGEKKNYPPGNVAWGVEIDLDVEMVSAACPLCTIYLIEANGAGGADLQKAEAQAPRLGARIVTNSWVCPASARCLERRYFDVRGVEYLAADGGSKYSETIFDSSAGGCAAGVQKPPWQHEKACRYRLANDAAAVASNIAEYDSYGYSGWLTVGGTGASAPLLAGVFGLA